MEIGLLNDIKILIEEAGFMTKMEIGDNYSDIK
jgi:hypothetical protein